MIALPTLSWATPCQEALQAITTSDFQTTTRNHDFVTRLQKTGKLNGRDLNTALQSDTVLQFLSKMDVSQGLTYKQALEFGSVLYAASNVKDSDPNFWQRSFPSYKIYLQRKVQNELLSRGILSGLKELGMIRNPQTEAMMKTWQTWARPLLRGAAFVAVNALSISLAHFPSLIPKISLLDYGAASERLLDKIEKEGFDAAYPDLKKELGYMGKFDYGWMVARNAYYLVMLMILLATLVHHPHMLIYPAQALLATKPGLQKVQDETFNPVKIRQMLFENWKLSFYDFEGRMPDPAKHPEDAKEWNDQWQRIQAIPDDQLKVNYGKH